MAKKSLATSDMSNTSDEFETMYKANAPLIQRFMFWRTHDEMLSEDLTSNVFEKAWRTRTSFTGGSATAWLYRIAQTTLIDHWRKRRDVAMDDEATNSLVSPAPALEETLDREMAATQLQQAVDKLPKQMGDIVSCRFMEGLSARQTAERLGLSEANVRVIQYRALQKLRGYLR